MPKHTFNLIVFDWDGTLMDSTAAIVKSLQDAALDLGLPIPGRQEASHVIGLGLKEALETVLPDLPRDTIRSWLRAIVSIFWKTAGKPCFSTV